MTPAVHVCCYVILPTQKFYLRTYMAHKRHPAKKKGEKTVSVSVLLQRFQAVIRAANLDEGAAKNRKVPPRFVCRHAWSHFKFLCYLVWPVNTKVKVPFGHHDE